MALLRVLRVRASALGHKLHLQGISLVQIEVVDVRPDEMVMPVEVKTDDAALALVLGVVVTAAIVTTLEHLATARVDLELVGPASNTPINVRDVLALLQLELPVLIFSACGAEVLDSVSTG